MAPSGPRAIQVCMTTSMTEVLERAGAFFMGRSPIHQAAVRIAEALVDLEIPFAIAGALAANAHGYRRETEDVDLLMTSKGLARFKAAWLGRGWVERFEGSRGMRDAIVNVKIDVLITGDFPGDGRPKSVSFPHPSVAEVAEDGLPYIPLKVLVELKLASGLTAPHRLRDLADVIELIRQNTLPADYPLDPFVTRKYGELWKHAQVDDEY